MHYHHHYAIGNIIASSLIHAVICGVVWRVVRHTDADFGLAIDPAVIATSPPTP